MPLTVSKKAQNYSDVARGLEARGLCAFRPALALVSAASPVASWVKLGHDVPWWT